MQRIAVIGNAGGGKSTLCMQLSQALNIPVHMIDKIQWKPGWVSESPTIFTGGHAKGNSCVFSALGQTVLTSSPCLEGQGFYEASR
jgi:shikimate kinase